MSCTRVLLAIIFPPLAVLDYGCGPVAIVTLLSVVGWVPGVIAALVICGRPAPAGQAVAGGFTLIGTALLLCLVAGVFLAIAQG